jgi:hypothetical protein
MQMRVQTQTQTQTQGRGEGDVACCSCCCRKKYITFGRRKRDSRAADGNSAVRQVQVQVQVLDRSLVVEGVCQVFSRAAVVIVLAQAPVVETLEGDWTQAQANISALHSGQLHGEKTTRLDGSTNSKSKNSRYGGEMSKGGVEATYDVPACIRDPGEMWCRLLHGFRLHGSLPISA